MIDHLFVYGTLRSGGSHGWRLAGAAPLIGKARMPGRLYLVSDYPGLVRDGGDEWVIGEVYRMVDPVKSLIDLDDYEGRMYAREHGIALMSDGGSLNCWVYAYRGAIDEQQRITSGDFLK